jgi:hypothetical protein
MTHIEALITLARRYCQDNYSYWAEKYSQERTGNDFPCTYSDTDYNLFPRYKVLSAILSSVETLTGQDFQNIESCQNDLKIMAFTAKSTFTTGQQNDIEKHAIEDECRKFAEYIGNLSSNDLINVEPLPYKRRMKEDESLQIRSRLLEKWNYDGDYWDPLVDNSPRKVVFLRKKSITDNDFTQIIEFIRRISQPHLYQVTEEGNDAEIEFSLFHPDSYETIYFDKTFEWVVYGSHESTITFSGGTLLNFIEQLFSDRKEKLNNWDVN